jgi:DNA-binding CsgD family transcriptional regulator
LINGGKNNMYKLTEREKEVLGYICRGYSDTEIAKILWISTHTAKSHVKHILKKFAAKNRTHLAYLTGKTGFTDFTNS